MKYLKTKTNIFEIMDETENVYIVKSVKDKNKKYPVSKFKTINLSDNLEELCDEMVLVNYKRGKIIRRITCIQDLSGEKIKCWIADRTGEIIREENLKYHLEEGASVYGAIWVNDGLKYVAKLNEKGEISLL